MSDAVSGSLQAVRMDRLAKASLRWWLRTAYRGICGKVVSIELR